MWIARELKGSDAVSSCGYVTTEIPFSMSSRDNFSKIKQVFSWEPIRCHDTVDVGWSRLSDLNVHEGKLLGCSSNQSCVGIWVVDLTVCYWLLSYISNTNILFSVVSCF